MGLDHDTRAALAALAVGYRLDERQRGQFASVLEILEGDEHAPTAVRGARQAVDRHVADSLVAMEVEAVRSARRIADIGAGAGFPGLVLAIASPASDVCLVESQARKCAFLGGVLECLGLTNARVVHSRVEGWSVGRTDKDLVVARALAPQPVVLEYAAPLLRTGGTLVDWRGRRMRDEEQAAGRAARDLGLRRMEIRRVEPFEGARDRHLHVFAKVAETPERFPRRPGVARKRPLGAPGGPAVGEHSMQFDGDEQSPDGDRR